MYIVYFLSLHSYVEFFNGYKSSEGTQDQSVSGDTSTSFSPFGGTVPLDWLEGIVELDCYLQFWFV